LIYTNPSENRSQSFNYFRFYVETAGFTLWAFQNKSAPPVNGLYYTILDIPYNNFVKVETDLRRYFVIDPNRMFATRIFAGTGFHFWNSDLAMPYIKQYYAGGSSDIRAWRVRHLGPGSFAYPTDVDFINQTGDIKLEGSAEYRFGIFGLLKGALFADGGNVWTYKPNALQPGGDFQFNRFYKQFALGGGLGFRLDFGFFIFRLDMAVPLRDPALRQLDDRWLFNSSYWPFERSNEFNGWLNFRKLITYNLAIGYPF
jgi:outer membrane protein insertion porin family